MVGGDKSNGIARGQWGRGRSWLLRFGTGGKGYMARGHLDPKLAKAQEARCPPSLHRLDSLGSRGSRL